MRDFTPSLPRPVLRERAGVRALWSSARIWFSKRALTLPSPGVPGEGDDERCLNESVSLVRRPSTAARCFSGLAFFNAGGKSASGVSWYAIIRTQRRMAAEPTLVKPGSVVAGYGPPWTIALFTSTPVG